MSGGGGLGGREGRRLQQGPLHMAEIGLPELLVPAGDKRCPDGVVEDILDTELRHHSRLVAGETQLLGHLSALLRGKDLIGLDGLGTVKKGSQVHVGGGGLGGREMHFPDPVCFSPDSGSPC